jgi:hypothetical protein
LHSITASCIYTTSSSWSNLCDAQARSLTSQQLGDAIQCTALGTMAQQSSVLARPLILGAGAVLAAAAALTLRRSAAGNSGHVLNHAACEEWERKRIAYEVGARQRQGSRPQCAHGPSATHTAQPMHMCSQETSGASVRLLTNSLSLKLYVREWANLGTGAESNESSCHEHLQASGRTWHHGEAIPLKHLQAIVLQLQRLLCLVRWSWRCMAGRGRGATTTTLHAISTL